MMRESVGTSAAYLTCAATLKKTALNDVHRKLGGEMTDFGGWEMPLWYPTGSVKEHLAVIERSGVFDVGHMDLLRVRGKDAFDLLQLCLTRDIAPLAAGACGYSVILDERGHVVDDAIVYNMGKDGYILIVNANMGQVVREHLTRHRVFSDVSVTDESGKFSKIDIQGPASPKIVRKLLARGRDLLGGLRYFRFRGDYADPESETALAGSVPVLLSRTGYTGEVGFEIVIPYGNAHDVWDMIIDAGGGETTPCGLAARDSLRTGAVLPLSHQDIGDWPFVNTPWNFALPLDKDGNFTKKFIGCEIYGLGASPRDGANARYTYPFRGFDPRKVEPHGASVLLDGVPIGEVTTCAIDMAIGRSGDKIFSAASGDKPDSFKPKGLVCGFVRVDRPLETGRRVILKDARRSIVVEIVNDIRPARTARIKF
jgi:aminomethyltransferase